jgi:hypothetical protein
MLMPIVRRGHLGVADAAVLPEREDAGFDPVNALRFLWSGHVGNDLDSAMLLRTAGPSAVHIESAKARGTFSDRDRQGNGCRCRISDRGELEAVSADRMRDAEDAVLPGVERDPVRPGDRISQRLAVGATARGSLAA